MEQNRKDNEIHYCNTCKHSQKPMTDAPCSDCVPGIFGGTDKWEAKKIDEDR